MKWIESIKVWGAGRYFMAWEFPLLLQVGNSCWWQLCLEKQQAKQMMWWGLCLAEVGGWCCHSWKERWTGLAGRGGDGAFNFGIVALRVPGSSRKRYRGDGGRSRSRAHRRGLVRGTHLSAIWTWVVSDTMGIDDINHDESEKRKHEKLPLEQCPHWLSAEEAETAHTKKVG